MGEVLELDWLDDVDTQWDWYTSAREATGDGDALPPTQDNACESGYYRLSGGKTGPHYAVAIWRQDGALLCQVNGKYVQDAAGFLTGFAHDRANRNRWLSMAPHPIAHEVYLHVAKTGEWPGEGDAVEPIRGVGDNSANAPSDMHVLLLERLAELQRDAKPFDEDTAKITTEEAAKLAASLRDQLAKLANEADAEREREKRPSWDECVRIDAKWAPLIKPVKQQVEKLKAKLRAFMMAKEAEARRIAAKKAEVLRQEALKRAAEQAAARQDVAQPDAPAPQVIAPKVEPEKTVVLGFAGKTTSLKPKWVGVITDYKAALTHYADRPEVVDLIQKLANADARTMKDKCDVPGVQAIDEKKV